MNLFTRSLLMSLITAFIITQSTYADTKKLSADDIFKKIMSDISNLEKPKIPTKKYGKGDISKIINTATNYAKSIACGVGKIKPHDVAALIPYNNMNRNEARYAVLWDGDIECYGGSGTNTSNILIISVNSGDSYFVIPSESSPTITFETFHSRSSSKIFQYGKDYIILEGFEYHPSGSDAMCCPSLAVRKTVRLDKKGNWKPQ